MKIDKIILLSILLLASRFNNASAQATDSLSRSDSLRGKLEAWKDSIDEQTTREYPLWLMACLSVDGITAGVGDKDQILGYDYKFGATWQNQLFLLDIHATHSTYEGDVFESHRFDYALLYGVSARFEYFFMYAGGGPSYVDYRTSGNVIPGTSQNPYDYMHQELDGSALGIALAADIYFTLVPYWGVLGIGFYGTISKNASYFSIDMSGPLEFNIPVWFAK